MKKRRELTRDYLFRTLRYDPETGNLHWLPKNPDVKGFNRRLAGKIAGTTTSNGYTLICLGRLRWSAHRLVWFMMTGEDAPLIDHIDGNKANNRFSNLRSADKSLNAANSKIRTDNTSGSKGVSWDAKRGLWAAYINTQGRRLHLGRFATKELAAEAYANAASKAFGDFARFS